MRKYWKILIPVVLLAGLLFAFAACETDEPAVTDGNTSPVTNHVTPEETVPDTDEPTDTKFYDVASCHPCALICCPFFSVDFSYFGFFPFIQMCQICSCLKVFAHDVSCA